MRPSFLSRAVGKLMQIAPKRMVIPAKVAILSSYHRLLVDRRFLRQHAESKLEPIPPANLRFRVAGDYDIGHFHRSGLESRQAFEDALADHGASLEAARRLLDFGTGCGRIMRWMRDVVGKVRLDGVDVDPPAIEWSRSNLDFATFTCTQPLPPMPFEGATFDLVFSHSVFSHLDVDYQDAWLADLRRVSRPGSTLLVTVHGEHPWRQFFDSNPENNTMQRYAAQRDSNGHLYVRDDVWTGLFPDFYHTMFHTEAYVRSHWSEFFDVLDYRPRAMLDFQDMVVLRHPKE